MSRFFVLLLFSLVLLTPATAQKKHSTLKKDIAQAKTYLKAGNNLDKAEQLMQKHLADSANRRNERLWLMMFDAVRKQYEQGNMKLYLKQKYDTAAFFNLTKRMFTILETFDSIDAEPNPQGEIKAQYRKKHSEFLDKYRANLFNGGVYFIGKQKFAEAYGFFDCYIDCARQPLFESYDYRQTDERMPEASYWATYCGYKMQQPEATLRHTDLALKDTAHYPMTLQYLADTYKLQNDTAKYIATLNEGFGKYPLFSYFFPRLVEYHTAHANWDEVLKTANFAIAADTTNTAFRLVRTTALLNQRQYDTVIHECGLLIAADSTLVDAWYNLGMAYFSQAVNIGKSPKVTAKQKQQMMKKYQSARHYLEHFRQLAPDQRNRWALPLYTIYLNLNMGDKFDEIDRVIRSN